MYRPKPCLGCEHVIFKPYSLMVEGCEIKAPQVYADFEYTAAENPCPYFEKYKLRKKSRRK